MICKMCGAQLTAGSTVCPVCGAAMSEREGGVGFWDMLDGPRPQGGARGAVAQEDPRVQQQANAVAHLVTRVKGVEDEVRALRTRTLVVCGLSAVCAVGALVAGVAAMRATGAARELAAQNEALSQQVETLSEKVDDLSLLLGEDASAPQDQAEQDQETSVSKGDEETAPDTSEGYSSGVTGQTKVPFPGFTVETPFPSFVDENSSL